MKIIKKVFKKDRKGMIQVKPTEEDDTWYLYNIIKPGNMIKMKIQRKVKIDTKGDFGVKKVKKKLIVLCLRVLKVDF